MVQRILFFLLIFNIRHLAFSQNDSTSLDSQLKRGSFSGHFRTVFMATQNAKGLTNYSAWAAGITLEYNTPKLFNFLEGGIGGNYIGKIYSTDLTTPNPITGQISRYELGLFDVQNREYNGDFLRVVKLSLTAHINDKSSFIVGRQLLKTAFFMPQDGRMSPTLAEALVYNYKSDKFNFSGQYIWGVSPRSTTAWLPVGKSIGVYSVGRNEIGESSKYRGFTDSKGVIIVESNYKVKGFNFGFNNTFIENISNTTQAKIEYTTANNYMFGFQYIHQAKVKGGGNENPDFSYFRQGKSDVFSARIEHKGPAFTWNINGTRITANGRYLMPREWSQEPFYTFMSRERNEGAGDVWAFNFNTSYITKNNFHFTVDAGYYKMPDVLDFRLSKYGMPSYIHTNLNLTYSFPGYLKGLEGRIFFIRKYRVGDVYGNQKYVMNKVNVSNINLMVNYIF